MGKYDRIGERMKEIAEEFLGMDNDLRMVRHDVIALFAIYGQLVRIEDSFNEGIRRLEGLLRIGRGESKGRDGAASQDKIKGGD